MSSSVLCVRMLHAKWYVIRPRSVGIQGCRDLDPHRFGSLGDSNACRAGATKTMVRYRMAQTTSVCAGKLGDVKLKEPHVRYLNTFSFPFKLFDVSGLGLNWKWPKRIDTHILFLDTHGSLAQTMLERKTVSTCWLWYTSGEEPIQNNEPDAQTAGAIFFLILHTEGTARKGRDKKCCTLPKPIPSQNSRKPPPPPGYSRECVYVWRNTKSLLPATILD